ncbi:OmpA family protein [Flavobacterium sp.]|uniref:OmpA family protein n=1 Tax=Flavobacterium sp. TaxID=239 RepID=UPI002620A3CD|nr:OmpA family protein [Flavobacterium sp.]
MKSETHIKNNLIEPLSILFLTVLSTLAIAQENSNTKAAFHAPIYTLYYPTDHWELTIENTDFLYKYVIQEIQKPDSPHLLIYLEGHSDDVGDSDYNMKLSQQRVQAVAEYLKSNGYLTDQIKIQYFGESKPETRKIAVSNKLKDIRYANRRVVIRIEKID